MSTLSVPVTVFIINNAHQTTTIKPFFQIFRVSRKFSTDLTNLGSETCILFCHSISRTSQAQKQRVILVLTYHIHPISCHIDDTIYSIISRFKTFNPILRPTNHGKIDSKYSY